MGTSRPTPLFRSTVPVKPSTSPRPATSERYQSEASIGTGGMGQVERGVDRFLGRPVALKRSLRGDPQMLEMLLREAEIAARLHHPSIVTIHDVAYDTGGEPFVVMRLVDGKRLTEIVVEAEELPARLRLLPRVVAAAEAVAFAHRQGVVHRDLKPDNILIGELGDTVVIDWGLALDLEAGADPFAGSMVGTPGFMSPEQEHGQPVDARTDVFALGVTLFFVLTGKLPAGESIVAAEPGMPRDLAAIVDKARAADPQVRYATAEELAVELSRFIGGQLVAAHHYGLAQRIVRLVRQHRIAATALVATAIIGGLSIGSVVRAKADAERERAAAVEAAEHDRARADQFIVDRAQSVIAEAPARAVALLDLRASQTLDGGAWAIAAEAAARGVPQVWKAHDRAAMRVLALGDGRVASVTVAGTLAIRTPAGMHAIAKYRGDHGIVPVPGGFVAATSGWIQRFDAEGEPLAGWSAEADAPLVAGGGWVAWRDPQGVAARSLDGTRVQTLAAQGWITHAIDLASRWWAVADDNGIRVMELATGTVHTLSNERAGEVVWSRLGDRLTASVRERKLEWQSADWTRPPEEWTGPPKMSRSVNYLGEQAFEVTIDGCVRMRGDDRTRACAPHYTGMLATAGHRIAVTSDDDVWVYSDTEVPRTLVGIGQRVVRIDIDPRGREVAAATLDGNIVHWDLAAGGTRADAIAADVVTLDRGHVIFDSEGKLIDLARDGSTSEVADLGLRLPGRIVIPLDRMTYAVMIPGGALEIVHRGGARDLVGDGNIVAFVAREDHLVFRDVNDRVWLYDIAKREAKVVAERRASSRLVELSAGDRDPAFAVWADGHVWWLDDHGVQHTAEAGCTPTGGALGDDAPEIVCGRRLVALRGAPVTIAELRENIVDWTRLPGGGYLVLSATKAVWRVIGPAITQLIPPSRASFVAIGGGQRVAVLDLTTGVIATIDAASGARAEIGKIARPLDLSMSPDGRTIAARGEGRIFRWDDPTPVDAAEWPAWRAQLTNAVVDGPSAALRWR